MRKKNRQSGSMDQFQLVLLGDWEFKWILDKGKQGKLAEKVPNILSTNFNEIDSQNIKDSRDKRI